jgi:tetratricopeptide (TPR) repeat protein
VITLRTYPNATEAGLAKSILDGHNIFCSLADENANLYGGAPLAMPVRLLVNEEQADEALRILKTAAQEMKDAEASNQFAEQTSMSESVADILDELKKLRSKIEYNTAILLLLIAGFILYAMYQFYSLASSSRLRQRQIETWNSVNTALEYFQYDKATDIAQRLTQKDPNYYYGYTVLGHIALERNRLREAEGYFARGYELFPIEENEQKLRQSENGWQLKIQSNRFRAISTPYAEFDIGCWTLTPFDPFGSAEGKSFAPLRSGHAVKRFLPG